MHFAYAILRLQLTRVCLGSSASAYTFARRASMVSSSRTHLAVVLWCLGPLGMPPYLRDPGAAGGTRFDLIMQGSTGCKLGGKCKLGGIAHVGLRTLVAQYGRRADSPGRRICFGFWAEGNKGTGNTSSVNERACESGGGLERPRRVGRRADEDEDRL